MKDPHYDTYGPDIGFKAVSSRLVKKDFGRNVVGCSTDCPDETHISLNINVRYAFCLTSFALQGI